MSDGEYGGDYGLEHEHADLAEGHEHYEQEHDHDQHFAAIAEAHAAEHNEAYAHGHQVEYDDGHGGHLAESDFTEYSEHDAKVDTLQAVEFDDHEHSEVEADLSYLQEHFDELITEHQPHEIGGELHEIEPSEHHEPGYEPEQYEPDYAPDVKR
jgi:hypothetical protein